MALSILNELKSMTVTTSTISQDFSLLKMLALKEVVNVKHCEIISTGKDDYLEVKNCLRPKFAQVSDLQQHGIEVDGIHCTVKW